MTGLALGPTAVQVAPWLTPEWLLAGLVLLGAALFAVLGLSLARTHRRAVASSARELTRAADEIGDGAADRVPVLAPDDPLEPLAAALRKLSATVESGRAEIERRTRGYEEILASATDVVVLLVDAEGDIRYASPGAERLFGWKSGQARGLPLAFVFPEEGFDSLLPKLSRRSLKDVPLEHAAVLRDGTGQSFRAQITIASFKELPGGGEGFFLEVHDLRKDEALKAELHDSEQKHRALSESLPLALLVVQNGKIVFANRALEEMLGGPSDPPVGRDFRDFLLAEELLSVLDRLRRVESGEEPGFDLECRLRPSHSRWPIEVSLTAGRMMYGSGPAVVGVLRDAGPDRGLLRQVRVSEAKLDAALGASEEAVLLLSAGPNGGTVTLANRRFEQMFGLEAWSLAGLSVAELADRVAPLFSDPEAVRTFLTDAAARGTVDADGDVATFETTGEPSPRSIQILARAAHARDGRAIGRALSARDVTRQIDNERRLAAEAAELQRTRDLLQRANADLERVNRELSEQSEQVEKANLELRTLDEMKSNLLANVSHELQTPLVSIKGYTEMILKGRLGSVTDEQKKGLEVSLRNIDRLIGMINNLLNFSRIERDMASMTITTFPLPEVVDEAIELVREIAQQHRIAMTSRYMTDELTVKADRDKISQVFINLIENAVKYNRDGGQVQVDVRKGKKGYLIVDVRDTGIGIPRDSLDKIFDRLYRVGGEPASGVPGSGIGLSIVRDILRMHGCIIKAESTLGEGTVFTFTLPVVSREEPAGLRGETAPRGSLPNSI